MEKLAKTPGHPKIDTEMSTTHNKPLVQRISPQAGKIVGFCLSRQNRQNCPTAGPRFGARLAH